MSEDTGIQIFFKKDYMQYTGSFKERGARYTLMMLEPSQKKKGVIAASAGNHALALAYHGGQLGILLAEHSLFCCTLGFYILRLPSHDKFPFFVSRKQAFP